MAADDWKYHSGHIAEVKPMVLDVDGKIDSAGAAIALSDVGNASFDLAAPSSASSSAENIEATLGRGIVGVIPKETRKWDIPNNVEKTSGGGSGGGSADTITIKQFDLSSTTQIALETAYKAGAPVRAMINDGVSPNGEETYRYLLGQITSLKTTVGPNAVQEQEIVVTGKSYSASAAGDTALVVATAAIDPTGPYDPVTAEPLVAGDLTTLKSGSIVRK